jgi:hypothetical protein
MQLHLTQQEVDLILRALGEHEKRKGGDGSTAGFAADLRAKIEAQAAEASAFAGASARPGAQARKSRIFQSDSKCGRSKKDKPEGKGRK